MMNIAIIGFGVVGGGVAEVLKQNEKKLKAALSDSVNVKYILDMRDFPDSPWGDRVVHDIKVILEDPDVKVVVETMGGSHPAFEFSTEAMKAGKSVVTSNKEVVANFGIELLKTAKENHVQYLFEASVGGGIPLIRSIRTSLSGDVIDKIDGIMNGTTNFILTKMKNEGLDYNVVLKEAQALGYAEKNPSADVDGIDTQRKITILTALASGILLKSEQVYAETMTKVSKEDLSAAASLGCSIKLIGSFRLCDDGKVVAWVCPSLVENTKALAHVDDVYNAISVNSPVTNDVMYYGRGAGRYPTAGAVVSDIVSIFSGSAAHEAPCLWESGEEKANKFSDQSFRYYLRVKDSEKGKVLAWGDVQSVEAPEGQFAAVIPFMKESLMQGKLKMIDGEKSLIRFLG